MAAKIDWADVISEYMYLGMQLSRLSHAGAILDNLNDCMLEKDTKQATAALDKLTNKVEARYAALGTQMNALFKRLADEDES